MTKFVISLFCATLASAAFAQNSTVTLTAGASSTGVVTATATATPYNPQGCSNPGEPDNIGSLSIGVPGNNCTNSGEDLSFSCSSPVQSPGKYTVSADYSGFSGENQQGDSCFVAGASASATVIVPTISTTTSLQMAAPQTLQVGEMLALPVVVSAAPQNEQMYENGTVTLYFGSLAIASAPLSWGDNNYPFPSSTATISKAIASVPTGTYLLFIAYSGDGYYSPSQSANFSITVLPAHLATTSTLSITPNPIVKDQTATLSVTVTPSGPNTPTGSVTILEGSTILGTVTLTNGAITLSEIANLAPGTYNIQALYSGDTFNLPSTSPPVAVTVASQTATTTSLTVAPSTIVQGSTAQLTASVSASIGNIAPTGSVTITANGTPVTSLPLKNGSASVQVSTTGFAPGTYRVVGEYNGSTTAAPSTSAPQTVVIVPASMLTLTASPNPVKQGNITTLTALVQTGTGSPVTSGSVTFSYAGNALGSGTLNSSGIALLPIETTSFASGTYTLSATYAGSGNIPAATGTVSLVVK